jgi:5'-nucleotidase
MKTWLDGKLVVAISSRALFDFEEENQVFEQGDDHAYMQLQLARLDCPAKPGVAFSLVKKLLTFNHAPHDARGANGAAAGPAATPLPDASATHQPAPAAADRANNQPVEVVILSRNDPVSGLRVMRSAAHYQLPIFRCSFTRGESPWRYLKPLRANLFLSTHLRDVRAALQTGVPAAQVYPHSARASDAHPHEVRIAFDGDAVLFSDEAERVYQAQGLEAFQQHEKDKAQQPLLAGPFKPLLAALQRLRQASTPNMRIRTALITARSAPAHERAIRTLMNWRIEVDEAMFLGGLSKGEFLREFEPDFFFDDQTGHVRAAAQHVPAGHVVSGVTNGSDRDV